MYRNRNIGKNVTIFKRVHIFDSMYKCPFKDGCKQTSKLIHAQPQNTASNPIRSGCFPDVHSL